MARCPCHHCNGRCGQAVGCDGIEDEWGDVVCVLCFLGYHRESALYPSVKLAVEKELKHRHMKQIHVEITADGLFSKELIELYDDALAFEMARRGDLRPDLMCVCFQYDGLSCTLTKLTGTIEVKRSPIENTTGLLQGIKYGIQWNTHFAWIITPWKLPEHVRQYVSQRPEMLHYSNSGKVSLGTLDVKTNSISQWVPLLTL